MFDFQRERLPTDPKDFRLYRYNRQESLAQSNFELLSDLEMIEVLTEWVKTRQHEILETREKRVKYYQNWPNFRSKRREEWLHAHKRAKSGFAPIKDYWLPPRTSEHLRKGLYSAENLYPLYEFPIETEPSMPPSEEDMLKSDGLLNYFSQALEFYLKKGKENDQYS